MTFTTKECIDSGMLLGYANESLCKSEMDEVEKMLGLDLELGEELERIYILLEQGPLNSD